jgi:hypothetical protein
MVIVLVRTTFAVSTMVVSEAMSAQAALPKEV